MGISNITDYSSMFANYRVPVIPSVNMEQLESEKQVAAVESSKVSASAPQDIDLSIEEIKPQKSPVNVNDISLTFNTGDDYGYIGKDSDIGGLDMQKAISDMQKDQVLQQYQYFVGNSENFLSKNSSDDGSVFLKF